MPICTPCPGQPTLAQRLAHEVTHYPYRKWCEHCVRGRAVGPNARTVKGEHKELALPRAHFDYAFIQEDISETEDELDKTESAGLSMTIVAVWESLCDGVWTYAVRGKGVVAEPLLPPRIAEDLSTVGMGSSRMVLKTDTEAAIIDVRKAIGRIRGSDAPTTFDDSRVGDSNSNAKIERTIREVKGLIRTLRSSLSSSIKAHIGIKSPILPWIVRHARYILTRCKVLNDGQTA